MGRKTLEESEKMRAALAVGHRGRRRVREHTMRIAKGGETRGAARVRAAYPGPGPGGGARLGWPGR